VAAVDPFLFYWLAHPGPRPALFRYMDADELRQAWEKSRACIMAIWAMHSPGMRPPAWWMFDSPEALPAEV